MSSQKSPKGKSDRPMSFRRSETVSGKIHLRNWEEQYNEYSKGKGPKPGPHPEPMHEWNIKLWDEEYAAWKNKTGEMPGPHPDEDHPWNKPGI